MTDDQLEQARAIATKASGELRANGIEASLAVLRTDTTRGAGPKHAVEVCVRWSAGEPWVCERWKTVWIDDV